MPPDPAQIVADGSVAMWQEINRALSTVLGERGAAILYKRSLRLARFDYPWLPEQPDLSSLRNCLAMRSAAEALSASNALLVYLYQGLLSLIGPVLTDKLLEPLWAWEPLATQAQLKP